MFQPVSQQKLVATLPAGNIAGSEGKNPPKVRMVQAEPLPIVRNRPNILRILDNPWTKSFPTMSTQR
eukprot:3892275-Amphidinium_carterae.1